MNHFEKLLEPVALRKLLQTLATLDAIVCPEWEYRYHSFQCDWSETTQMAGIRNGCGDDVFFLFTEAGCYIKGFAHEYWKPDEIAQSYYVKVPKEFVEGVVEPAFSPEDVSFCFWHLLKDGEWQSSKAIENFDELFLLLGLDGHPSAYQEFAQVYYDVSLDFDAIKQVYQHVPLSSEVMSLLNKDAVWNDVKSELKGIGYPFDM